MIFPRVDEGFEPDISVKHSDTSLRTFVFLKKKFLKEIEGPSGKFF